MTELKNKVILYKRFRSAAPVWRAILAAHQMQIPQARKKLIDTINLDLRSRSMRMFETLAEIAENNQLLEVEIYNGAGQDIIWQNAHPDYKQIAQRLRADFLGASANKTWDWGHALAANDEVQEVWEDELGSFNAEIYDNCSSKDKYLALRQQRK